MVRPFQAALALGLAAVAGALVLANAEQHVINLTAADYAEKTVGGDHAHDQECSASGSLVCTWLLRPSTSTNHCAHRLSLQADGKVRHHKGGATCSR